MTLIITEAGFINVEQACEINLRYHDVRDNDEVDAIDLRMTC